MRGFADILVPPAGVDRDAWLAREGRGIVGALCIGADPFDAATFALLRDLHMLHVFGEGMEAIDLGAAAERGIRVTNAAGLHADDIAIYAVALTLAAWCRLPEADDWVRSGRWCEAQMPSGRSLVGARIGVVGLGNIGVRIAEKMDALGCETAWWGPREKPQARWPRQPRLLDLAAASDALIVAVRGGPDASGLIDRPVLDALGPAGLFVNISRGHVVDEPALIAALRERCVGQAALDVFDPEPASRERWVDVPNVLLSPHRAGNTTAAIAKLADHAVATIRSGLADLGSPRRRPGSGRG